ncbi:GtrA family protein [Undibacterium sp. TJN25]|uniref:GtrA family protein n=1 Tax=Undibacterium sp. TJN25 TaxID=3413056 RepID=UPI003BF0E637
MVKKLSTQVLSFAVVGGIGFLIDAGVLTLLSVHFGVNVYTARVVSFALASLGTWLLNRRHTFGQAGVDNAKAGSGEYLRYMSVQAAGAMINLGVFSALVVILPSLARYPVIPLAAGSGVAMFFNFFGARHWIYRQ